MRRLPVAAFVALAIATVAAFFVTQHLKVSTPLINGYPFPHPGAINPVDGQVCHGVGHRVMHVSFYLQSRSDDVDVYIVDANGTIVRTLASGRHMIGGTHPVRSVFSWDGRLADGSVAPDGTYFIRVSLIHQGRSVLISNQAGAEPVTVETVPPRPRVTAVSPALIPQPGAAAARIRSTGTGGRPGRILVYRTDLPGPPRLVKSFSSGRGHATAWDGTVTGGRPAPQGTYLIGLKVTDQACNTGRFPAEMPPPAGSTPHAGVTVRYVAAQPPLDASPAGTATTVYVDARRHRYHWALRPAGAENVLASGATSRFALGVRLPRGAAGLYQLAVRYGAHRTVVPLVASAPAAAAGRARVLVILPALTWQGLNPVDDSGDGQPETLIAGGPIKLGRVLTGGLPAGFAGEAALLADLRRARARWDLTTDLSLIAGTGPALSGHRGVVLAGDERWVPAALAASLRAYVTRGGHVLSLGIDSLRRAVTVAPDGRALDPTGPRAADLFGARPGRVQVTRGALILAGRDGLGLFSGTSGALRGFRAAQSFAPVTAAGPVASLAGASSAAPSVIGFRLGRGMVIEIGLPGFASRVAHDFDAGQLLTRIWAVLSR